jgi:hypothetical protein
MDDESSWGWIRMRYDSRQAIFRNQDARLRIRLEFHDLDGG